jgi:hypothetical protein
VRKRITEGMKISTNEMHGRSNKLGLLKSNVDKSRDVDGLFEGCITQQTLESQLF